MKSLDDKGSAKVIDMEGLKIGDSIEFWYIPPKSFFVSDDPEPVHYIGRVIETQEFGSETLYSVAAIDSDGDYRTFDGDEFNRRARGIAKVCDGCLEEWYCESGHFDNYLKRIKDCQEEIEQRTEEYRAQKQNILGADVDKENKNGKDN